MRAADTTVSHDVLNTTLRYFLQKIKRPCRVLVAVSGGSDSKGLLIALHQLLHGSQAYPVTLVCATVDHGLRPESATEAREVANLCSHLGIAHLICRWDGPKPKTGISAASRNARYRLLADAATTLKADMIVTGHTADDQAETIAMRKQRSANLQSPGLSGMADRVLYQNRIWIYRPLLTCRRDVIRNFLSARGMGWVDDPSNSNPHYERARVRATLAKTCDSTASPSFNRAELSNQAARLISTWVHRSALGVLAVNNAAFEAPADVLRYALQALVATIGGQSHGPAEQPLLQLLELHRQPNGARTTLGRCLVHRHRQGLLMVREARDLPSITVIPGETALWDGRWQITNTTALDLFVTPTDSKLLKAPDGKGTIPASIITLGCQSVPKLQWHETNFQPQITDACQCQPVISQYLSFLPGFDWSLACVLADLFKAKPFFPPVF
jgi:tRNA(Ile)-lysidine synthase